VGVNIRYHYERVRGCDCLNRMVVRYAVGSRVGYSTGTVQVQLHDALDKAKAGEER